MDKLDKLGTVTHAISPNLFHYSYAANFKKMYPNATLWGVPGLDIKKPELPIDRIIKDDVNSLWNGLEYSLFDGLMTLDVGGSVPYNELLFFPILQAVI
ncbi:hypothetical protein [Anaplasma marginale]|uniref:hypothetical protein n=1 Tax=Anaplasma marginale TaxID=770 RepID=UPI000C1F5F4B|nr:hypothetical protein [Anaplasma marginale]